MCRLLFSGQESPLPTDPTNMGPAGLAPSASIFLTLPAILLAKVKILGVSFLCPPQALEKPSLAITLLSEGPWALRSYPRYHPWSRHRHAFLSPRAGVGG